MGKSASAMASAGKSTMEGKSAGSFGMRGAAEMSMATSQSQALKMMLSTAVKSSMSSGETMMTAKNGMKFILGLDGKIRDLNGYVYRADMSKVKMFASAFNYAPIVSASASQSSTLNSDLSLSV